MGTTSCSATILKTGNVTLTATKNTGCTFDGWGDANDTTSTTYTVSVTNDMLQNFEPVMLYPIFTCDVPSPRRR